METNDPTPSPSQHPPQNPSPVEDLAAPAAEVAVDATASVLEGAASVAEAATTVIGEILGGL